MGGQATDRPIGWVFFPRMLKALAPRAHGRSVSTLARHFEVSGVGLHTGASVRVVVRPAATSEGVYFVRSDLGMEQRIAASLESVTDTRLSTTLGGCGDASVRTVEHLLAALCGAGVSACRVEINGPELPLLDGSAAPWLAALLAAGVAPLTDVGASRPTFRLKVPCWVHEGDAWVVALPADTTRLAYGLEFASHPPIGRQWASWAPCDGPASFADEIAPARTFGLFEQLDALREQGISRFVKKLGSGLRPHSGCPRLCPLVSLSIHLSICRSICSYRPDPRRDGRECDCVRQRAVAHRCSPGDNSLLLLPPPNPRAQPY